MATIKHARPFLSLPKIPQVRTFQAINVPAGTVITMITLPAGFMLTKVHTSWEAMGPGSKISIGDVTDPTLWGWSIPTDQAGDNQGWVPASVEGVYYEQPATINITVEDATVNGWYRVETEGFNTYA